MKKYISLFAFALLASAVTLTFSACGGDDDDDAAQEQGDETPQPKFETQTVTVGGVSFKMVAVEGGTFQMGAPDSDTHADYDEKPQHSVTLSNYYIGETEVTQALWKAVMGNNPSYFNGDNLPVEEVSLNDCQEFINNLNEMTGKTFRLPTEAEWEYAARGGKKSLAYTYSGSNDIGTVAWYNDNSGYKTHAVGTKAANELGLYDMSGNVTEYCQDWYGAYDSNAQTNPQGPASGSERVFRGGGCDYIPKACRSSFRNYTTKEWHDYDTGLRLAMSI